MGFQSLLSEQRSWLSPETVSAPRGKLGSTVHKTMEVWAWVTRDWSSRTRVLWALPRLGVNPSHLEEVPSILRPRSTPHLGGQQAARKSPQGSCWSFESFGLPSWAYGFLF